MGRVHQRPNYKKLRIANTIKLALIKALQSGKIDRALFDCKVTVTKVVPSVGETLYTCYVLPFGPTRMSNDKFMHALNNSLPVIRKMITQSVNLKYAPELRFIYDHGFDNASEIDRILQSIKQNSTSDAVD